MFSEHRIEIYASKHNQCYWLETSVMVGESKKDTTLPSLSLNSSRSYAIHPPGNETLSLWICSCIIIFFILSLWARAAHEVVHFLIVFICQSSRRESWRTKSECFCLERLKERSRVKTALSLLLDDKEFKPSLGTTTMWIQVVFIENTICVSSKTVINFVSLGNQPMSK